MLDRTNAERQRRYRARHMAPALTPRQRDLIIDAVHDKLVILDRINRRVKSPLTVQFASEYRVIFDALLATWRMQ